MKFSRTVHGKLGKQKNEIRTEFKGKSRISEKNNENLTGMNRPYSNNDRRQDLQENTALSTKGKQSIGRPRK
jgi:hypothetical protein